ncbi:MAG: DUF4328 domain-containing protein [Actinomycetota bacterium]
MAESDGGWGGAVDRVIDRLGSCPPALVRVALGGVAVALLVDVLALTLDLIRLRRLRNGATLDNVGLDVSSTLSGAANLLVPLAVLGAGAVFLWWFAAAYRRLGQVHPTDHGSPWAVAGWLVPGVNLVRPPTIMRELVSKPGSSSATDPAPVLVLGWWILMLEGFAIQFILRLISPATNWGWTRWQTSALLSDVVLLASLGCVAVLIGKVEERQRVVPELSATPMVAATSPAS